MGDIIGYYGSPGSNTHDAKIAVFGEEAEELYSESFEGVFKLLMEDKVKYAILPIENSSTGGISDVTDLLNKYDTYIVGEKCLKIEYYLLAVNGTKIDDIEEVYSHPQGLQQCKTFLEKHKDWKLFNYYNTAKSVEYVKLSNCKNKAAIGNLRAANLYGLQILDRNISSSEHNYTRFAIIGKELEQKDDADKISIIINLPHIAGSLNKVINIIGQNNLNMTRIESRPILHKPWEYTFYIDFEANLKDKNVKDALNSIKEMSTSFKLLGSYKKDA